MSPQTQLRLDRLSLSNFRCFAECEIDLHPELTVLVAENGRGKTAILDAIRIALGLFVNGVAKPKKSIGFALSDVRLMRGENAEMVPPASIPTGATRPLAVTVPGRMPSSRPPTWTGTCPP